MPRPDAKTWRQQLEASTVKEVLDEGRSARLQVPGLTILCHPDGRRVGERVPLPALESGRSVRLSRREPDFAGSGEAPPRPLADPHLSRRPMHLAPGQRKGVVQLLGDGGQVECNPAGEPVDGGVEFDAEEVRRGVMLLLAERVVLLLHHLPAARPARLPRFGMVGESAPMLALRREIERVSAVDVPVLLRGETGSGKELVAAAIHRASPRRGQPYVSVNIGAIPPTLAAAELFGAAKGAFTGAVERRVGYFARAAGGTLFLDEIGEAPSDVQVLMLRALETGEIQPVGGSHSRPVDVRILAATDADLETATAEGRFREPLLHRLNGYQISLPPLRRRRDDIGRLLFHFLRQELATVGGAGLLEGSDPRRPPWLPASLVARLAVCRWPGNVRQLRNAARQLVIAHRDAERIPPGPLVDRLLREAAGGGDEPPELARRPPPRQVYRQPADVGDEELLAALEENRWELKAAAAALGVSRTSLYKLIDRHPLIRTAAELERGEVAACLERHGGDPAAAAAELRVSQQGLRRRMRELGLS